MNKKEIEASVSSLRLDAVTSACFGCSRSKAAKDIKEGLLVLRENVCKIPAQKVNQGDTIIYGGRGQCIVEEVMGLTRSKRQKVRLTRLGKKGGKGVEIDTA